MKRKVLVLASFPAPYRIGVFRGLAKFFDMDVFFATGSDQDRSKDYFVSKDEFSYYIVENKDDAEYFQKCVSDLKQYDFVLAYDWYLPYALNVEWKCIRCRVPYIVNCDGAFIPNRKSFKDIIKSFFIKNASICFAGGKSAEAYFKHYHGSNIVVHRFSSLYESDIAQSVISTQEKLKIKNDLGLKGTRVVLAIGQFISRKGFDVLLEAWGELDNNYCLVIIGGGEEKNNYKRYITEHEYRNVLLIDYLPKENIMQYYRAADLFVLPTREDVWGLVVNEAMANGLGVISTERCNAATELIKEGKNGYIVPVGDAEMLREQMKQILLKNDNELKEISEYSMEISRQYTIEKIVSSHINAINEFLPQVL